jgi:hypothetical protein
VSISYTEHNPPYHLGLYAGTKQVVNMGWVFDRASPLGLLHTEPWPRAIRIRAGGVSYGARTILSGPQCCGR